MRSDWFPLLTLYPVAGKGIIPCWWDGKENIITFWPFLVLLRSPAICIHRIKKSRLLYSVIRSGLVFCIAIKRLKQISILLWGLSACQIVFSLFYDFFYQYILGLNFIGTIFSRMGSQVSCSSSFSLLLTHFFPPKTQGEHTSTWQMTPFSKNNSEFGHHCLYTNCFSEASRWNANAGRQSRPSFRGMSIQSC